MAVGHVAIANCWDSGGLDAANFLSQHGVEFDFDAALSVPGVDFLRPNGGNVYPGISREKDRSIVEEKSSGTANSASAPPHLDDDEIEDDQPFLPEDDAPTVFLEDFLPEPPSSVIPSVIPNTTGADSLAPAEQSLLRPVRISKATG
jgi:hypothetical protein